MYLKDIIKHSWLALDYMERVVNNGSQSGFTHIHATSKATNPFYSKGFFVKKLITNPSNIKCYGSTQETDSIFDADNFIYFHPDWQYWDKNDVISSLGTIENGSWVIPTSSSRTVRIHDSHLYLKLCYPGMIGRLNRELKYPQLISGIELTNIFKKAKKVEFPEFFDFMPEPYGRILEKNGMEMGFILRKIPKSLENYHLIPGFSLFSSDRNDPTHEPLLVQILNCQNNPSAYLLDEICFPLVDVFFACVFKEGLIPEMHSQNVLFAFDDDWHMGKIVLRDFESIDKDLSIRKDIGRNIDFLEYPYKCICESDEDYLKRHSFMYDHKLCEYLVNPLVECASSSFAVDILTIRKKIKQYVRSKYRPFLHEFFPDDNCWYKYPDTEIDRTTNKRPFVSMGEPVYR